MIVDSYYGSNNFLGVYKNASSEISNYKLCLIKFQASPKSTQRETNMNMLLHLWLKMEMADQIATNSRDFSKTQGQKKKTPPRPFQVNFKTSCMHNCMLVVASRSLVSLISSLCLCDPCDPCEYHPRHVKIVDREGNKYVCSSVSCKRLSGETCQ